VIWSGLLPAAAKGQPYIPGHVNGIRLSADQVVNGGVLLVEIDTTQWRQPVRDLIIKFADRNYPVYVHPLRKAGTHFSLVAIAFRLKPGKAALIIQWLDSKGKQSVAIAFRIVAGKYRMEQLTVDSRRVTPPKKDRERAQREHQEIKRIYAAGVAAKLWNGNFALPLGSAITSSFGNGRVFNGQLKSYHNGIDFRAPVGTRIFAANSGIVKLAKDLFYSGNAVIIDHGTGLFSIYAHLSELHVAAHQRIKKGQPLGLSGATGRVSGPHLHWGVKLDGIAVNPFGLVDVINTLIAESTP
jgi:murein DD-endopeptidase MepM/ murein hydrolase activator NlpD